MSSIREQGWRRGLPPLDVVPKAGCVIYHKKWFIRWHPLQGMIMAKAERMPRWEKIPQLDVNTTTVAMGLKWIDEHIHHVQCGKTP